MIDPGSATPPGRARWGVFSHAAFTTIWIASVVSALGTAVFDTASGIMITTLDVNPATVSLVQVAISLPQFLFTLPAGALADIVDSRRLLLVVEIAVAVVSAVFALLVALGHGSTGGLLTATFCFGVAGALTSPAWSAIVPQLVPRTEIGAAVAANSAGYSLARAVGPALGGGLIALAGLNSAFLLFAASNLCVVAALWNWRRPHEGAHAMPAERILSAVRNGVRFAVNSRYLDVSLARAVAYFPWACAYLALLPLVAKAQADGGAQSYGLLLGANSVGAIVGSLILNPLRSKVGADRAVAAATVTTAAALALLGLTHRLIAAIAACVLLGAAWTIVLSILYLAVQATLPDWVRARGLAVLLTVIFGATTLGSLVWGEIASARGLAVALCAAAAAVLIAAPFVARWSLKSVEELDMTASSSWPALAHLPKVANERGPVLVSLEFRIEAHKRAAFRDAARELKRARGRDGSYAWSLFEDTEDEGRFVEQFHMESWLELMHLRQRVTNADRVLLDRIYALSLAEPIITLLVASARSSPVHERTARPIDGSN